MDGVSIPEIHTVMMQHVHCINNTIKRLLQIV